MNNKKAPLECMNNGFTLLELIISIVIISIGIAAFLTLVLNTTRHSIDPMILQQSHAIAQSYMEEILTQPFCDPDNATCTAGCSSSTACTTCNTIEATPLNARDLFDAVCDYNGLPDDTVRKIDGSAIPELGAYNVSVTVTDSGVTLGTGGGQLTSASGEVVQINVNVTHDNISAVNVNLKSYKTNY